MNKSWSIGARFTHFWAWDLAVGDANQDGNDDVYVLDLMADITTQRVVTYRGPIHSGTQGIITSLGSSQQNYLHETWKLATGEKPKLEVFREPVLMTTFGSNADEGVDYSTGQVTNPGNDDNMTIIEFSCLTNTYPATYTFSATNPPPNSHVINMNTIHFRKFRYR